MMWFWGYDSSAQVVREQLQIDVGVKLSGSCPTMLIDRRRGNF